LAAQEKMDRIKRVYSHPQAIAQCQNWLERHLPHCLLIKEENTAIAVQKVLKDQEGAAIGSLPAAGLYGLHVLADRIEDYPVNTTRFLILGNGQSRGTGKDKTSILFGTPHKPGALFRALELFARDELNLLKIESYPLPDRVWEYLFFVDFSGHQTEERIQKCLSDLETVTTFIKVLGSYPCGELLKS
jgi:chorismate mutase/prephenate dehydratase